MLGPYASSPIAPSFRVSSFSPTSIEPSAAAAISNQITLQRRSHGAVTVRKLTKSRGDGTTLS